MQLSNIIHDNINSPTNSNILSQSDTNSILNRQRRAPHVRFTLPSHQRNTIKVTDPTCTRVHDRFLDFLLYFEDDENIDDERYYEIEVRRMIEAESTTLSINWQHMRSQLGIDSDFNELADMIEEDYYRFEPFINRAVRDFVHTLNPNYIISEQRVAQEEKDFHVSFLNFDTYLKFRELRTNRVGSLCCFSGTVTRTTQVRPELIYGSFKCLECGHIMNDVRQQFKYSEPKICSQYPQCTNRKLWQLNIQTSKFCDWQKVRVQENSSDLPSGSMPRSLDVILRNDMCETCNPGENIMFTGTLIVVPNVAQYYSRAPVLVRGRSRNDGMSGQGVTGLKALGARELSYKLAFLANSKTAVNASIRNDVRCDVDDDMVLESFTAVEVEDILNMSHIPRIYERMANSFAPSIYGHEEVKRGILLMLMGGVSKRGVKDGCKLRGDINVCIVGDPSTAKSQFLQFVKHMMPSRTVYTSGKSSTSAGLTAAVIRDKETGEFNIEAGALMLADKGICCIDEFDKMDKIDQSAIHEAMEQQTITITKAGINATLNARASVLAAANPVYGRYDSSKPLKSNINMSAPLMSRFDLFFVVVDDCDQATDRRIATHIVELHKYEGNEEILDTDFTVMQMQKYIKYARTIDPQITKESAKYLVKYYRELRQSDAVEQKAYRFTVRQLESMIRLSEALARVHLNNEVLPKYVKEAARLLGRSIVSVDANDIQLIDTGDVDDENKNNGNGGSGSGDNIGGVLVSFREYQRNANIVVSIIRRNELSVDDGLAQLAIENHYMRLKRDEISDVNDIQHEMKVLRCIIKRLVDRDRILVFKPGDNVENMLLVHPNYDCDRELNFIGSNERNISPEVEEKKEDNQSPSDDGRGGGRGGRDGRGSGGRGGGRGGQRKIVRGKRRTQK